MDGDEAARVLGVGAAAYRKRLSRARDAVVAFTRAKCGLVNPQRPCRCRRRLSEAVRLGRVTPGQLLFASDAERARQFPKVLAEVRRLEEVRRAAALFRSHPDFTAPADLAARLRKMLEGRSPMAEGRSSALGGGGT